jgi:hypothetical protein
MRVLRCASGRGSDLGRDEGRETALLDEAHLDGWGPISTNCTRCRLSFGWATHLGGQDDEARWGRR